MQRKNTTVDGNEAAALMVHSVNEVIAIYTITSASPMGELVLTPFSETFGKRKALPDVLVKIVERMSWSRYRFRTLFLIRRSKFRET